MLPPGGEGEVKVTLTPKGNHEDILKRIVVISDDPEQPRFTLTMKGKLLVDLRAKPGSLTFANISPGEPATLEFTLEIREPTATKLDSITVEDTENFELRALEPSGEADPGLLRYELRFVGSKTVGNIGSRVEVRTSGPNTPELNIPIRASVVSNLRYSKRLHFAARDESFVVRQLRVSTRDGTVPKIKKIDDPAGLLTFEIREPVGGTLIIDARVDEAKFAALAEHERSKQRSLTLHTDDPDEPRVEITYSIGVGQKPGVPARRVAK